MATLLISRAMATFLILSVYLKFTFVQSIDGNLNSTDSESAEGYDEYDFDDLLEQPKPEDKDLTLELEKELKNDSVLDCTTKEDVDLIDAPTITKIKMSRMKWKNFNVYIDPDYSYRDRTLINNAMARLNDILKPCGVRFGIFRPGSRPVGDYVHVFEGKGCWSLIGRMGGRQLLSLDSPGCMQMQTILHELIHSLGLHHEQNRPDRDDYVKILWQNIPAHARVQFEKRKKGTDYGIDYDQNSIMHYGPTAFSKNGFPTIIAKNGLTVGPIGQLTPNDIENLKRMYC